MKRLCLLMLFLILPLNAGMALAGTGYMDSSSVQLDLINQNPDPVRPGEPVELTFSVQNVGNKDLENIVVEVSPEYPFSKISGEELEKEVSYLNARQDDDDAAIVKFKLLVDPDVSEGSYEIDITTTAELADESSGIPVSVTKTFDIEIRGKEYAQIVTISRTNIDLAKEEPLEFIITNTGNSPLKNMVLSWKDPKGVILPVSSDNTKYIKYLDVGESVTVSYSVMADVNAEPGLYQLDICLSLEDYDSVTSEINTTAGLFVGGETDFDVSFSESSSGELSLSVANVGNNMAYSVKVMVPEQDGYRVTGSSSSIVGNLEKGDYTITSFKVANMQTESENSGIRTGTGTGTGTAKAAAGKNSGDLENVTQNRKSGSDALKVQIEYTDSTGERHAVEKDVAVQLTGSTENMATRNGQKGSSNGLSTYLPIVLVLGLAGAGFILYRRKKQGKGPGNKGL